MYLIEKNDKILVDSAVFEFLIPTDYQSRGMFIRQAGYYSLFLAGMGRFFNSQKAYETDNGKTQYKPIAIPIMVNTKPSLVETDIVELPKGGSAKAVYKLVYYKDDEFITNTNYIKLSDNTKNIYQLFDDGKADFIPYTVIAELLETTHYYNNTKFPVPLEAVHAIVAERSKDPKDYKKDARFMNKIPEAVISLNPRETMAAGNVAGMFGFEDVNSALMIAANRKEKGIVDPATITEKIILTAKV